MSGGINPSSGEKMVYAIVWTREFERCMEKLREDNAWGLYRGQLMPENASAACAAQAAMVAHNTLIALREGRQELPYGAARETLDLFSSRP